jgi:hypothetical protein
VRPARLGEPRGEGRRRRFRGRPAGRSKVLLDRNIYVDWYHTCRSAKSGKGSPDDRTHRTDGYGVGATTERPVTGSRGQRTDGEPKGSSTVPRTVRRPSSEERESGPSELDGSRTGRKDWGTHNQSASVQRTAEGQVAGHVRTGSVNSTAVELAERVGENTQPNRLESVSDSGTRPSTGPRASGVREVGGSRTGRKECGQHADRSAPKPLTEREKTK